MPTVRQFLHALDRASNPHIPPKEIARKYYAPQVAELSSYIEKTAGYKRAQKQLRELYTRRAIQLLPPEEIAERVVDLAKGARSEQVRLTALGQLLCDLGIREPADQREVLLQVTQHFVAQVGPVLLAAIPQEYHAQVRTAIRQAIEDGRKDAGFGAPILAESAFRDPEGVTPQTPQQNAPEPIIGATGWQPEAAGGEQEQQPEPEMEDEEEEEPPETVPVAEAPVRTRKRRARRRGQDLGRMIANHAKILAKS